MADSMHYMADEIEAEAAKGFRLELAINNVVTRVMIEHQNVVFNGNGYSPDWIPEAEKRGLKNFRTAPEAIRELDSEKNVDLFEKIGVLSRREVESQQHILFENFSKTVQIEADCLTQMISASVIPASLEYKNKLITSIDAKDAAQARLLDNVSKNISELLNCVDELKAAKVKANAFDEEHLFEQATFYRKDIMDIMAKTRVASDYLETIVDDKLWPFPKYSEILLLK